MLHSERIHGFMLDLPCEDLRPPAVVLDQPAYEGRCRIKEPPMTVRSNQFPLWQRLGEMMPGHEELGIAKGLDRAHAEDDLLPSRCSRVYLTIQRAGVQ